MPIRLCMRANSLTSIRKSLWKVTMSLLADMDATASSFDSRRSCTVNSILFNINRGYCEKIKHCQVAYGRLPTSRHGFILPLIPLELWPVHRLETKGLFI